MDDRRPATLSDEALDRELRAAFDVAPSPEFVARVRAQVARELPAAGWLSRRQWLAVAATAAAALVTIAALTTRERHATPARPAPSVASVSSIPSVAPQATDDAIARAADGTHRRGPSVALRTERPALDSATPGKLPEVLVSADEQAALLMLLRMAQDSSEAERLREQAAVVPDEELSVLDTHVIEIEPLPQIARLE